MPTTPRTAKQPTPARSKRQATARLLAAESRLAEALALPELNAITAQVERTAAALAEGVRGERSALTGEPLPPAAELEGLRLANLQRAFAERRRLLHDALTTGQVAELLGTGRQTPHDRLKAGSLLGIKDGGQWRFPLWQFDPGGPDGLVRGLPETLKALGGPLSDLARVQWFVTPKSLLAGRPPIQALRDGDVDDVIAEARAVGTS